MTFEATPLVEGEGKEPDIGTVAKEQLYKKGDPPKVGSASPIEFKRVIFHVLPAAEARAEAAAVKFKQAKDAYASKSSGGNKTKLEKAWAKVVKAKSQLDFVAKKLELMATYAADHGLKHASDEKKKEIQALIGKSVSVISVASSIGKGIASGVNMPSANSHLGDVSSALTDLIATDDGFKAIDLVKADFKKDKNYDPGYKKPDSNWQGVLGVKGGPPSPPVSGAAPKSPPQKKGAGTEVKKSPKQGSAATGPTSQPPGDSGKSLFTDDEADLIKQQAAAEMIKQAGATGSVKFSTSKIFDAIQAMWPEKLDKPVVASILIADAYKSLLADNLSDSDAKVLDSAINEAMTSIGPDIGADDYGTVASKTLFNAGFIPSIKDYLDHVHAIKKEKQNKPKTMSMLSAYDKKKVLTIAKKTFFKDMGEESDVPGVGMALGFHAPGIEQKVKVALANEGFNLTKATMKMMVKGAMSAMVSDFDSLSDSQKKVVLGVAKSAIKKYEQSTGGKDGSHNAVISAVVGLELKVFSHENLEKINSKALAELKEEEDNSPDVAGAVAETKVGLEVVTNDKPISASLGWIKKEVIKGSLGVEPPTFFAKYNIPMDIDDNNYGAWASKAMWLASQEMKKRFDPAFKKLGFFAVWNAFLANGDHPIANADKFIAQGSKTFDQLGPSYGHFTENIYPILGITKNVYVFNAFEEWKTAVAAKIPATPPPAPAPPPPAPVLTPTTPVGASVPADAKKGFVAAELTDEMSAVLAGFIKDEALPGIHPSTVLMRVRKKFKTKYGYVVDKKHIRPLIKEALADKETPGPTDFSKLTEQVLGMSKDDLMEFINLSKPAGSPDKPDDFPYSKNQASSVLKDAEGKPVSAGIGYHAKSWADGPTVGQAWMFKPSTDMVASAEIVANRIQRLVGVAATDHAWLDNLEGSNGSVQLFNAGDSLRQTGVEDTAWNIGYARSLQKTQISNWLFGNHDDHGDNLIIRGPGEVEAIDHGQAGKFFSSGEFSSQKKGYTAQLSSRWSPPSSAGFQEKSLSVNMLRRWEDGEDVDISLMDSGFLAVIDRSEAIPSDVYKALWRPYAEAAFAEGELAKFSKNPKDKTVEGFLDGIDARRRRLRQDVIEMYRSSAERRANKLGVPYSQVADDIGLTALENTSFGEIISGKVMGVAFNNAFLKAEKTKDVADIQAARNLVINQINKIKTKNVKTAWDQKRLAALEKYTQDLDETFGKGIPETSKPPSMALLKKRGFLGSQMIVGSGAGENDVRDAKMSVWNMGDSAFGMLNLSRSARDKIEAVLAPYTSSPGSTPAVPVGPIQTKANKYRDLLLPQAARSRIKNFVDHGINSSITPIRVARANLSKWSEGKDLPSGVLAKDKKEFVKAAKHYYDYVLKITKEVPNSAPQYVQFGGIKWEMDVDLPKADRVLEKEFEFKGEAEEKKKEAEEAAKKKSQKPAPLPFKFRKFNFIPFFQGDAKGVNSGSGNVEIQTNGKRYAHESYLYGSTPLGDKTSVPHGAINFYKKVAFEGKAYEIDLGDGVIAVYQPEEMNSLSKRGVMKIKFGDKTKDGDIEKGLAKLSSLGINVAPATHDETEVAYLRKMAWMLRRAGSGEAEDLHEMEPSGATASELIDWYKDKLTKKPSVPTVFSDSGGGGQITLKKETLSSSNPAYSPIPEEFGGVLEWRRPDVDDAMLKKLSDDYVLYAGTGSSLKSKKVASSAMMSWEWRSQRGLPVGGASNSQDERSGGSHDVFLRLTNKKKIKNPCDVRFSARRLAYTGWNFNPSDSFGNKFTSMKGGGNADVRKRYTDVKSLMSRADKVSVKCGASGGNEIMVDGMLSIEQWGEKFEVGGTAAEKKKIIDSLKKRGFNTVGQTGKKVEDLF